jgi:hypothetical protein
VSSALLCSFAGGVEPFLPPLEEPVVYELVCGSSFVAHVYVSFLHFLHLALHM